MLTQIFKSFLWFFAACGIIILNSCSSTTEPEVPSLLIIDQPVISGISTVNAEGVEIKRWGNPISGPINIGLYPNPTSGPMSVLFLLGEKSRVTCWLVKGRLAGEKSTSMSNQAGAIVTSPVDKKLLFDYELNAGTYKYDFNGNNFSSGFYRIYMKINGKLTWKDFLLARTEMDYPPGFLDN